MPASLSDNSTDLSRANIVVLGLAFLLGIILRIIQFAAAPSYWKDELFSIINIENMSLYELLTQQPAYNQVAGVGYYLIQKTILLLAGESNEYVLRFYPFIASILSMWVFYLIAKRFLGGWLLVASVGLFCLSLGPWLQSFNAKPYSGDLLFIMWFTWFLLFLRDHSPGKKQILAAALIGFIGAIASLPVAVFVFGAILFLMLLRPENISLKSLMPAFILWTLGALWNIYYAKFVITPEVESAMFGHHAGFGSFPPTDSLSGFLLFYPNAIIECFGYFLLPNTMDPVSFSRAVILLLLSVGGIITLLKKDTIRVLVLLLPLLMAIALVTIYTYPMMNRVSMFAFWPFILLPFIFLDRLNVRWARIRPWMVNTLVIILILPSLLIVVLGITTLPLVVEPAREALTVISENKEPGDDIYVHADGDLYLEYYAPRVGIDAYILGSPESLSSEDAYREDLAPLDGRVWYLFIGIRPEMNPVLSAEKIRNLVSNEAALIREYNWTTGYPSYLRLYDFSRNPDE